MSEAMPEQNHIEVGGSYGRDQVLKIINSVISKVEHTGDDARESIFKELKELRAIIDEARAEIGMTRPSEIKDKHIPTATDELDAVVEATAEATGAIMDSCDVIMDKASAVGGENGDAMVNEVTKIYEACSFQDITGQRITKVVKTLKDIEVKVEKLLAVVSHKMPGSAEEDSGDEGKSGDAALLNGPQLPGSGISQDDIDKLLAEFD
ncbi:MAG: protein phosphatase CheZ [Alphaproteobacteria bacterium]|nr:protein phosphatase CheZ [Alphaproteobacteria bacterium]